MRSGEERADIVEHPLGIVGERDRPAEAREEQRRQQEQRRPRQPPRADLTQPLARAGAQGDGRKAQRALKIG